MRLYETSFLIAPTLPEEEAETLIEKMAGIVSEKKGKMINVDNWGKKRLAYPIKKFEDAVYVFFLYKGEIDIPTELERNFKQTESVIRYLTIKLEERDNVRRKKKGAAQAVEPPREAPPVEKKSEKPEEKKSVEEKPGESVPKEEPKKETAGEETKAEPKEEPKEEKKEEKKAEKKEEVKTPVKKAEETKDPAPKEKDDETKTEPKKDAAPEKEETAVKEKKEK